MNGGRSVSLKEHIKGLWAKHAGLMIMTMTAVLFEITIVVVYFFAQSFLQTTMEKTVEADMRAEVMSIRRQLTKVVSPIRNMSWVIGRNLAQPDSMFGLVREVVDNNKHISGSGIAFIPDYYPRKGHWFEPYAKRYDNDSIQVSQIGSQDHDYTRMDFYIDPISNDSDYWCEPYFDSEGAKNLVTTYSVPVYDNADKIVAVVIADIPIKWLNDMIKSKGIYGLSKRCIVSRNGYILAGMDLPVMQKVLKKVLVDKDQDYITMTDDENNKIHVFYHSIGGRTDWMMLNLCYDKDIFGKLRKISFTFIFLILAGLIFMAYIIYRTSRNMESLRVVNAAKERIESELRVASHIQQSMLPHAKLTHDSVSISGKLLPAREVGGDLYDYFIRDDKLFFCIGDVSGKGVPGALLMAVTHSLFRSVSTRETNPAGIMQIINKAGIEDNDTNMFVTLFIGVLDLTTGQLDYCDAGHDAPILINTGLQTLECIPNLPIGVFDDVPYKTQTAILEPDTTIYLYTDGLTEAKNTNKDLFGLSRVHDIITQCAKQQMSPEQIIETTTTAVNRFVGNAEQSDDLTLLAIRFEPKHLINVISRTIELTNDINEITRVNQFIKSVAEELKINDSLEGQLQLAVEEATVNIINYAYPPDTEEQIQITVTANPKILKIVIMDTGKPFDPTAKEEADITLKAEEKPIGGLGILLVRNIMDEVQYQRINNQNILTLIKKI